MLRYKTKSRPGLVALYDIWPGNGVGPFLQPRSPHGAKHCQRRIFLICFWNLRTYDYDPMSSPFEVRCLLQSRWREGRWYSANHVSPDHWRHSQSSTVLANSSRFTGSPVRGSLNTHTRVSYRSTGVYRQGMSNVFAAPRHHLSNILKYFLGYRSRIRTPNPNLKP